MPLVNLDESLKTAKSIKRQLVKEVFCQQNTTSYTTSWRKNHIVYLLEIFVQFTFFSIKSNISFKGGLKVGV